VRSVDDLKWFMRRFVDEFQSRGDEVVADELLADTFRNHFVEHWNVLDTLALMRQIGGVAPPSG
jgi:hypothetical protein